MRKNIRLVSLIALLILLVLGWGLLRTQWLAQADNSDRPSRKVVNTIQGGEITQVQINMETYDFNDLARMQLVGDYLYAVVVDETQSPAWTILELSTGTVYHSETSLFDAALVDTLPLKYSLRWVDATPGSTRQMFVYDWQAQSEVLVASTMFYDPFVKNNVIVWVQKYDGKWMIVKYDIEQATQSIISPGESVKLSGRPQISENWLAYVDIINDAQAHLYVQDMVSSEVLQLATIPYYSGTSSATYTMEFPYVVWIEWNDGWSEVHVYNLATQKEQLLNAKTDGCVVKEVSLVGGVSMWPCDQIWHGIELEHNVEFQLPFFPFDDDYQLVHTFISETRMAWLVSSKQWPIPADKQLQLYTMPIVKE